ncbi:hypothetical protein OI70_05620 [Dickeya fangzhongdai]|nr:hypothetical protein LH89_02495 [Dickeya fangzhongdai]KGT96551.1 hypothetical protein NM75_19700 [Dickeya fangzhongdai]KHN59549.1 hypothetical protein OI70_05620 [Dickeya fangzhongdai]
MWQKNVTAGDFVARWERYHWPLKDANTRIENQQNIVIVRYVLHSAKSALMGGRAIQNSIARLYKK